MYSRRAVEARRIRRHDSHATESTSTLGPRRSRVYRDVQNDYGVLDSGGLVLFVSACECLDRVRQAQLEIRKRGAIDVDRYGAARMSPACVLERDARGQMLAALRARILDVSPEQRGRSSQGDSEFPDDRNSNSTSRVARIY